MADRFLLRRVWFQVHLWLGVALFLVLIPLSATGSFLVWHDALDAAVNPQRYAASGPADRPLEAYAAAARTALGPGQAVASVRLPEHDGRPVVVSSPLKAEPGARGRPPTLNLYLDPASGRVLDRARSDAGLVRWLHVFHGSLMMPGVGRKIVGWLGWAMFVSALTGVWLWWPRNHRVLKGFRWRRAPLLSSNLHHLAGFWISIPLAVLAFTGAWISFPQTFRGVVEAVSGAPPARERGGGPGGGGQGGPARPLVPTQLTADQAVAAVRGMAPAAELVSVTWPTEKKAQWSVRLQPEGLMALTYTVDDRSGRAKAEKAPDAAAKTARLMRVVHDGTDMGIVWQMVIFVGGLAPALLGITGVLMWLRNRGGRKARNAWRQNGAGAE